MLIASRTARLCLALAVQGRINPKTEKLEEAEQPGIKRDCCLMNAAQAKESREV